MNGLNIFDTRTHQEMR